MNKAFYSKTLHHVNELYAIVHNNELAQQLLLTRKGRTELSDTLTELAINIQIILNDDLPEDITLEEYEGAYYHG